MKKVIKLIVILVVSLLTIYILFLTEESIRLQKGGEPLIILNEPCDNTQISNFSYETTCHSIGFKIKKRYTYEPRPESDVRIVYLVEEEFWLFDKFLIWGWVS